jgi:GTP-binding protein YchF
LPNVGKSTLFNAITRAGALVANYPFATIDKNVGVVLVPDERLEKVAGLHPNPRTGEARRTVPTHIEFVDIAGLVRGASRGEGLGNQFLAHVREADAIAHVVRCFDDPDVVHVTGKVDAPGDIETVNLELILADLQVVERRLEKVKKTARIDPKAAAVADQLERIANGLRAGRAARELGAAPPKEFGLVTAKPVIYVANVDEDALRNPDEHLARVTAIARGQGALVVAISARIESEIAELPAEEAALFLADLGLAEPGLDRLVKTGYRLLGLISFLTENDQEARAWAVRQGTKAPQAAGQVHTDMERGFIRAETIAWHRLVEAGSMAQARARGWVRTEGKEYVVQDGDVIYFLFNV